jgi:hypothetical protein
MGGFKPTQLVRLQGLRNAAYNGKLASVTSFLSDDGRHDVTLLNENDKTPAAGDIVAKHILRIKLENLVHACNHCHKTDAPKMQFCSQCRMAGYCNAECQRNDWHRHKDDCKMLSFHRDLSKIPLFLAACSGDLVEMQNLVQRGADIYKANKDGQSPLSIAAQHGHLSVVQYLVQQGADKDKAADDGFTPLFLAATIGHLMVVQYLVQQGADKDKADNSGKTPFFMAAQEGHLAVVRYLGPAGSQQEPGRHRWLYSPSYGSLGGSRGSGKLPP